MIIKTKDFQYECASAEQHSDGLHLLDENGEVTLILNAKVVEVIGGEIKKETIASHNIMEGEYITIDGMLYMATQNIPNGEPIIVGQNAIVTTVEAQLLELKGE